MLNILIHTHTHKHIHTHCIPDGPTRAAPVMKRGAVNAALGQERVWTHSMYKSVEFFFLFFSFFHLYKLDESCVHGACLGPLLITAWGLSLVFSSSFRFMAWITAISLASFFWFLASNSNLNQTKEITVQFCSRYNRRQATVCPFTLLWR